MSAVAPATRSGFRPLATMTASLEPTARLQFGAGAVRRLPEAVRELGRERAFVVTDPGLVTAGLAGRVGAVLGEAGVAHEVFDAVAPNPTVDDVAAGVLRAREFGDAVVVAFGGGSAMDAAKAISLLAVNCRTAEDVDAVVAGTAVASLPGMPVVAVPTTAGTGAETNGFGVIEDVRGRRKVYLGDASVRPRVCVLDPELTLGLPRSATAATGIDALVHGIESLSSRGADPLSAAYASQAIVMISRWLPAAVEDGADLEARSQLLFGAHLAGLALSLSGLGLVHGLAHSLTNHFHTVHGVALAAVLPEVMTFSSGDAAEAYRVAATAMGVDDAVAGAHALADRVGVRRPLRDLGLTDETVAAVAAGALADAVTRNAPRIPTQDQAESLLRAAL